MRSSRRRHIVHALTALGLLAVPPGLARAQDEPPVVEDPLAPPPPTEDRPPLDRRYDAPPAPAREEEGWLPSTLLGWTPVAEAYDDAVAWKDEYLPLTIGASHWYHVRRTGPLASEYGIPALLAGGD